PYLGEGSHHFYSRVGAEARAKRLGHHGLVVLLDGGLAADAADRIAGLEHELFRRGVVAAQVGLDLEAAVALAKAGVVALAAVAATGRERARELLRAARIPWTEAEAAEGSVDVVLLAARQGVAS
ncbi:MAG TPA: hypothetical protein PKU97_14935, partial [Kofleriaceae bacterium]|nr:hypothetical protein [Kofleriaceae bacterium]